MVRQQHALSVIDVFDGLHLHGNIHLHGCQCQAENAPFLHSFAHASKLVTLIHLRQPEPSIPSFLDTSAIQLAIRFEKSDSNRSTLTNTCGF